MDLTSDKREITKLQELTYELKIEDAMSRNVFTVSPDASMADFREVLTIKVRPAGWYRDDEE